MEENKYLSSLAGFHNRCLDELVILLYHGVTSSSSIGIENVSRKHISEVEFRRQIRFVKENCNPLTIEQVVYHCRTGQKFPPHSVAITFDDGFKNNFEIAAPVLREYQVPAVFYVCAGVINTDLMFWVDELECCINSTKKKKIKLKLGGETSFKVGTYEEKLTALEKIKSFCKLCSSIEKSRIVREVVASTEIEPGVNYSENYQKISWQELIELDRDPLFTIGAHTLYHDVLRNQPEKDMYATIQLSLDLLSYNLQHSIHHFSYPEGQAAHYDQKVIDYLKRVGVVCSPSAIVGLNPAGSDPFHLKRIMVGFDGMPFPYLDTRLK
ncbi:MAG: polysaccharide deacetylase [Rhodospirillaceae bacterium]|nr:polysaccharide deacetylase [Rhodospirillaceae bacterium]|tara:strand:- start:1076 stop:2050 length:975 start_codon:yes stop_codon:yes gene_type:complete